MIPSFSETYFYYFVTTLMWTLIVAAAIGPIAIGIVLGVISNQYNWFYFCALSLITIPLCRTIFVFNKIKDNTNVEESGTEEDDGSNDQE